VQWDQSYYRSVSQTYLSSLNLRCDSNTKLEDTEKRRSSQCVVKAIETRTRGAGDVVCTIKKRNTDKVLVVIADWKTTFWRRRYRG
jgi:hypothetical protein